MRLRPIYGPKRLMRDRRGMAAVEFALIAPTLIVLVMGVLELSFRFRAKEEATRYVHVVSDLLAREETLTTQNLKDLYSAAPCMMKPLDTASRLDLDISSITYGSDVNHTPSVAWRRVAGTQINFTPTDYSAMGGALETVIRVGVRYQYTSPISSLFGGPNLSLTGEAITRPRETRVITMDGLTSQAGITTFTANTGPAPCAT